MELDDEFDQFADNEIETTSTLNSVWLGLIFGILAPIVAFMMFYFSSFTKVPLDYFVRYSLKIGALINILTVCLIPNFLIFALFIWRKHYTSAKGIVIASASLTALFVLLKIFIALYLK